jgi:hypothetical protein
MNLIGKDCEKIIMVYKKEFERVEYNQKQIDNCIFEEFDLEMFNHFEYFNDIFYIESKLEKKFFLSEYTIEEFKEYYLNKKYFMKISFKFLIENEAEDYFKINLKSLESNFLKNLSIYYIYKLNNFNICLHLGNFNQGRLHELYENIAINYINDYVGQS